MGRKVLGSLSCILADAQERGLVSHNALRDMSSRGGAARNGGR